MDFSNFKRLEQILSIVTIQKIINKRPNLASVKKFTWLVCVGLNFLLLRNALREWLKKNLQRTFSHISEL
jgi:hypothetical protein